MCLYVCVSVCLCVCIFVCLYVCVSVCECVCGLVYEDCVYIYCTKCVVNSDLTECEVFVTFTFYTIITLQSKYNNTHDVKLCRVNRLRRICMWIRLVTRLL